MKTYQLFLFYIILVFSHCQDQEEYSEQCKTASTKEGCKAVELNSPAFQCCYTNDTEAKNGDFDCLALENGDYEIYSKSKEYYYRRETIGFECYYGKDPSQENDCDKPDDNYFVYECKRGTVYDTPYIYSEAEKNILRGENHCFSYAQLAYSGSAEINKNDCFNAQLTESTKNNGVTCAFLDY